MAKFKNFKKSEDLFGNTTTPTIKPLKVKTVSPETDFKYLGQSEMGHKYETPESKIVYRKAPILNKSTIEHFANDHFTTAHKYLADSTGMKPKEKESFIKQDYYKKLNTLGLKGVTKSDHLSAFHDTIKKLNNDKGLVSLFGSGKEKYPLHILQGEQTSMFKSITIKALKVKENNLAPFIYLGNVYLWGRVPKDVRFDIDEKINAKFKAELTSTADESYNYKILEVKLETKEIEKSFIVKKEEKSRHIKDHSIGNQIGYFYFTNKNIPQNYKPQKGDILSGNLKTQVVSIGSYYGRIDYNLQIDEVEVEEINGKEINKSMFKSFTLEVSERTKFKDIPALSSKHYIGNVSFRGTKIPKTFKPKRDEIFKAEFKAKLESIHQYSGTPDEYSFDIKKIIVDDKKLEKAFTIKVEEPKKDDSIYNLGSIRLTSKDLPSDYKPEIDDKIKGELKIKCRYIYGNDSENSADYDFSIIEATITSYNKEDLKKSIDIKPSHEGIFTAKSKKRKMGVQEFANHVLSHPDDFDEETRKQAQFAKNATKFNKAEQLAMFSTNWKGTPSSNVKLKPIRGGTANETITKNAIKIKPLKGKDNKQTNLFPKALYKNKSNGNQYHADFNKDGSANIYDKESGTKLSDSVHPDFFNEHYEKVVEKGVRFRMLKSEESLFAEVETKPKLGTMGTKEPEIESPNKVVSSPTRKLSDVYNIGNKWTFSNKYDNDNLTKELGNHSTHTSFLKSGSPYAEHLNKFHGGDEEKFRTHFNNTTGRWARPTPNAEKVLKMKANDFTPEHWTVPELSEKSKKEIDSFGNAKDFHEALANGKLNQETIDYLKNYQYLNHHGEANTFYDEGKKKPWGDPEDKGSTIQKWFNHPVSSNLSKLGANTNSSKKEDKFAQQSKQGGLDEENIGGVGSEEYAKEKQQLEQDENENTKQLNKYSQNLPSYEKGDKVKYFGKEYTVAGNGEKNVLVEDSNGKLKNITKSDLVNMKHDTKPLDYHHKDTYSSINKMTDPVEGDLESLSGMGMNANEINSLRDYVRSRKDKKQTKEDLQKRYLEHIKPNLESIKSVSGLDVKDETDPRITTYLHNVLNPSNEDVYSHHGLDANKIKQFKEDLKGGKRKLDEETQGKLQDLFKEDYENINSPYENLKGQDYLTANLHQKYTDKKLDDLGFKSPADKAKLMGLIDNVPRNEEGEKQQYENILKKYEGDFGKHLGKYPAEFTPSDIKKYGFKGTEVNDEKGLDVDSILKNMGHSGDEYKKLRLKQQLLAMEKAGDVKRFIGGDKKVRLSLAKGVKFVKGLFNKNNEERWILTKK